MFLSQPIAVRFGSELNSQLDLASWDTLDIAVAWVRASGMRHLRARMEEFLETGGRVSVVVGVDLENTTQEGLQALLDLEAHGAIETFVHHNEAGTVFHPKLYLFRNAEEARLIVASNNITEGGLFANVEAALQFNSTATDSVVLQSLDALASWRDPTSGLARRLDDAFLADLVAEGYVLREASVQASRQGARIRSSASRKLFGSRRFVAPRTPPAKGKTAVLGPTGTVLLMRLRKAHTRDRPTQTQIPIRVINTGFFGSAATVQSAHTNLAHQIGRATARGGLNTLKLEIPEMRAFADPVARFQHSNSGVVEYEVHDAGTAQGRQIMNALRAGRSTGETKLTTNDPTTATWWRFI